MVACIVGAVSENPKLPSFQPSITVMAFTVMSCMATDKTYALVMSGLDCFKQINDQYGHDGGDRVIAAFDVS
ncbi:diguanylate cyclase [Daeguia caeni]